MSGRIDKLYIMSNASELHEWLPSPGEEWTTAQLDTDVRGGKITLLKSAGIISEVEDPDNPARHTTYRTVDEAYEYLLDTLSAYY